MKINNIGVLGIGRLGLALSLNFERAGFNVHGCDIREEYVKEINNKKFSTRK